MNTVEKLKTSPAYRLEYVRKFPEYFCGLVAIMKTMNDPNEYKALAVEALAALSRKANTNFPAKRWNENGLVADRITEHIFEKQDIFDPYADPEFLSRITDHCLYYVLRYTDPDQNPKHTDFTPEQFAACFAHGGALVLLKRGCDFRPGDPETVGSDMENHRLFFEYANKAGEYICGDVCGGRWIDPKVAKTANCPALYLDLQRESESGTYAYDPAEYAYGTHLFTKSALLNLINSDALTPFDRVEIVDR